MNILQLMCSLLFGHEGPKHFERDRIYTKCTRCGHVSTGWQVKEATRFAPTARVWGASDYAEIYQDMEAMELRLHCGG